MFNVLQNCSKQEIIRKHFSKIIQLAREDRLSRKTLSHSIRFNWVNEQTITDLNIAGNKNLFSVFFLCFQSKKLISIRKNWFWGQVLEEHVCLFLVLLCRRFSYEKCPTVTVARFFHQTTELTLCVTLISTHFNRFKGFESLLQPKTFLCICKTGRD